MFGWFLLAFACSGGTRSPAPEDVGAPPAEVSVGRAPIIGGRPDQNHPAVGAVLTDQALCTGVLVSPNVAITAAHCLEAGAVRYFVLGSSVDGIGDAVPVARAIAHPEYSIHREQGTWVGWHDIAALVLSRAVDVPPVPWRVRPLEGAEGRFVTFVGFGQTDPSDDTSTGKKFQVRTRISAVWSQGFWNESDPAHPKNTCHGDSGGPALLEEAGVVQVAGIVSSGDAGCIESGYSTRVDRNADFIARVVADHPASAGGEPHEDSGCAGLTYEGCCDREVVRFCEDGEPKSLDCEDTPFCGWDPVHRFYDCGTDGREEPTGRVPMRCLDRTDPNG